MKDKNNNWAFIYFKKTKNIYKIVIQKHSGCWGDGSVVGVLVIQA